MTPPLYKKQNNLLTIFQKGYVSIRKVLNYLAVENIDYKYEDVTGEQLKYILRKYKVVGEY